MRPRAQLWAWPESEPQRSAKSTGWIAYWLILAYDCIMASTHQIWTKLGKYQIPQETTSRQPDVPPAPRRLHPTVGIWVVVQLVVPAMVWDIRHKIRAWHSGTGGRCDTWTAKILPRRAKSNEMIIGSCRRCMIFSKMAQDLWLKKMWDNGSSFLSSSL